MEEKEIVKCQFILANENEEIVKVIEGDDILMSYGNHRKMNECLENCVHFKEKNFHIKDIVFNCDIKVDFNNDTYDLEHYANYVGDQLQKINRLSCLQEIQALTECVTNNINEIIYLISMKEYRFFSNEKQEETLKILSDAMQNEREKIKLNNEGIFKTSTGIILFLAKPILKKDENIVLDDNKIEEKEQIQLKVLIAKSGEEEQQWLEFPMKNPKEIRTSIMRKFHPLDDVTIIKTWSNCGLIERRNCEIENLEDYVIYTQQELVELNKIADVEDVKNYTSIAMFPTPYRILELMRRK